MENRSDIDPSRVRVALDGYNRPAVAALHPVDVDACLGRIMDAAASLVPAVPDPPADIVMMGTGYRVTIEFTRANDG